MRDLKTVLLLAICTLVGHVTATAGDSIDRLGRLWGFGWSDGYHACGDNCYEVGENLPPLSYTHRNSLQPASSRQQVVRYQLSVAQEGSCPGGDCHRDWAPEAWQGNPVVGTPTTLTPTVVPDPVPMNVEPHVEARLNKATPIESLPTPKPARKAPILNDADDDLLPDQPESPSDSDLGSYLNSRNNLSPYRRIARPVQKPQASSQR